MDIQGLNCKKMQKAGAAVPSFCKTE
ncbi:uncharacterized protein G2W53_032653 [Senna tora]|uniref:Uncharacterized protein n=1 Tax=Senna tora TaxID=362788 RepID=A0A834SYP1_9FABA|nr:uncharacterized protein G2W53_032653 [Senna tora]